jgi:lysyl-tRNA synthetase class 2
MASIDQISQQRKEKLDRIISRGVSAYPPRCKRTHTMQEAVDLLAREEAASVEKHSEVSVCGRITANRGMGKLAFMDLTDDSGKIQIFIRVNDIPEAAQLLLKDLDIGDFIQADGTLTRTKSGEPSVLASNITILSKSLKPLPEKFHGLQDTETRYRQRYLDLIANPEVKTLFKNRARIISGIRHYLDTHGYTEVETPMLQASAGGATARPFITYHNALDQNFYLRIALELHLKRLIVGGFDGVYEIGRVFRNEGIDTHHNPEFTLLEMYKAYVDYTWNMDLLEDMVSSIVMDIHGSYVVNYNGQEIDFKPPWKRLDMRTAVIEGCGLDYEQYPDRESLAEEMTRRNIKFDPNRDRGRLIDYLVELYVEPKLINPTFLMDHPIDMSPLAKKKPGHETAVERFEAYAACMELANCYSELNDPIDQAERFSAQLNEKKRENTLIQEETEVIDEDFINAMEHGMPPTGGMGIGIDRLTMLLTGTDSIREVILFPTLKNTDASGRPSAAITEGNKPEPIDLSKVEIEPLFKDSVDFETFSKSDFRAVKVLACEAVPKSKKLLKFTLDDGSGTERTILSGIHEYYEPEELIGKTCIAIVNLPPRKMMGIDSEGMLISAVHHEEGEEKLHLLMVDPNIPAGAKMY